LIYDARYYEELLDDLYDGIEGLNVAGYRWDDTDGWERSRGPLLDGAPAHHLEFWIDLGGSKLDGSQMVHESSVLYSVRYQQEEDPRSQGIAQASIRDMMMHLMRWGRQDGVRTRPINSQIAATADYMILTVSFETRIPWRP